MSKSLVHQKICMLGIFAVGKTSLTRRFVSGIFDDTYLSTIGVKVSQKLLAPIETSPGKLIQHNFLIWDIEGFEKNSRQLHSYLTGTAGALLIADLTRPETVHSLPDMLATLSKAAPDARPVIIGNKSDLIKDNPETVQILKEIAKSRNLPFFLTSAKSGENVEASFNKLGLLIAT